MLQLISILPIQKALGSRRIKRILLELRKTNTSNNEMLNLNFCLVNLCTEKGLENSIKKKSVQCLTRFLWHPTLPIIFCLKSPSFFLWLTSVSGKFSPAHLAESVTGCLAMQGRTWNQLVGLLALQNSSAGGKDEHVPWGGSELNPPLVR